MLTIYGRKNSSNVQKVLWCCAEIGLAYERIDMGRQFGGNREPAYLALNPNGLVPTIVEEDGFSVWESNAIIRYLARRYGPQDFCPADHRRAAIGEQWMDWQLNSLNDAFTPMFHGLVREAPEHRDHERIEKSRAGTQRHLAMLDRHLQGSRFVAGDAFTVADIPAGIYAYRWYTFEGIERESLPALERWYGELRERAPYRDHVMVGLA
jgi:glutathione S-transferase